MRLFAIYLCLAPLVIGCEQTVPDYIHADREWNPHEYFWATPVGLPTSRLNEHSLATQNIRIRLPEARRRPTLPERRAVRSRSTPKKKRAPAMIKVITLAGDKPTEAYIWINGRKAGPSPMFIHLPSGAHRIDVQTPDGQKQTRELEIQPSKNEHVVFRFDKSK